MDIAIIIARVIHILLGVFWVGTMVFNAVFLVPSIRDAGPEGAKVVAGLMRRRLLDITPAAAGLTVLSGLYLYWRVSARFDTAYMRSTKGITYGLGAVVAIAALGLGVRILRPSMQKAAAITQAAATAPAEERERQLATAQALRIRAARIGQVIAWLLGFTAITMAIGRYV
ncbi:MAG TPA: hypothetical protein VIF83_11140 [Gemmatimonadaceae bacterium]|jgi:uncharacterized membrane protein